MVSCPHALASEAGVEVPSSATIEWFRSRGHAAIPLRGILPGTVTVPGAVDGWCQAHDACGRLTLARDLAAAVGYAREGFPVSRRLADWTEQSTALLKENQEAAAIFLPGGAPPRAGQRLRNPDLALTLERIATDGRAGFYEGETAREMARVAREGGGLHAERDFARQRAEWGEPLSTDARRRLIDLERALAWDQVPSWGSLAGDTVYVGAVDAVGNAASLIHSVYGIYGAGIVAGNTGVVLQNRGVYFSLDPEHPNRLEPGKRPLHTLVASLAFREDRLWQVFGCMGADGQPQIHLQAYTAMIDFGLDLQQAVESPRWLSGRFALGDPRDLLNMEGRFPERTFAELGRRGHLINRWGPWNELAGHAHGITVDAETGALMGGSDPRSDGAAIGY